MKRYNSINRATKADLIRLLYSVDIVLKVIEFISENTDFAKYKSGLLFTWCGSFDLYRYFVKQTTEKFNLWEFYRGRKIINWGRFAVYFDNIRERDRGNDTQPNGANEIDDILKRVENVYFDIETGKNEEKAKHDKNEI